MSGDVSARASRRFGFTSAPSRPAPPTPPAPPAPPAAPTPLPTDEEQLAVLRALEAGEIDVDEAAERLAGRTPRA
jgi:hypothetical protein